MKKQLINNCSRCLLVLALAWAAAPLRSAAVQIDLGGIEYTITEQESSSGTLLSKLEQQPWWGNTTLAGEAAGLVGFQLPQGNGHGEAVFFAYNATHAEVLYVNTVIVQSFTTGNTLLWFAEATRAPVPESPATTTTLLAAVCVIGCVFFRSLRAAR